MAHNLLLHQIFKSFPVGPVGAQQVSFFRRVYAEIPDFSAELARNNAVPVLLATRYPVAFYDTRPLCDMQRVEVAVGELLASGLPAEGGRRAGHHALAARTLDGLMVNVDSG